ncbi:hypothetical protein V490_04496, partial [Pseudogymnoascus sp. VKM F-3557]
MPRVSRSEPLKSAPNTRNHKHSKQEHKAAAKTQAMMEAAQGLEAPERPARESRRRRKEDRDVELSQQPKRDGHAKQSRRRQKSVSNHVGQCRCRGDHAKQSQGASQKRLQDHVGRPNDSCSHAKQSEETARKLDSPATLAAHPSTTPEQPLTTKPRELEAVLGPRWLQTHTTRSAMRNKAPDSMSEATLAAHRAPRHPLEVGEAKTPTGPSPSQDPRDAGCVGGARGQVAQQPGAPHDCEDAPTLMAQTVVAVVGVGS